jgi:adenylate kinase
MLNVILFGPPNCGKGTQADLIKTVFKLRHLSTGDMLRAEVKAGTELGLAAQAIMDRGQLVSDEIILGMIGNAIQVKSEDKIKGFLFDGFPRTLPQKQGLEALLKSRGYQVDSVVSMLVPEEELRRRMRIRQAEQGRKDDTDEVFERRMVAYNNETLPLAEIYRAEGVLREVDGLATVGKVFCRINDVVEQVVK